MSTIIIEANQEPIDGYRLRRYLGRGGFGEVWEAEAPGGLSKAVKIAPIDTSGGPSICRELEGLKKIRDVRHPYLLSIERFEVVDGFLVIVMELADQSLADRFHDVTQSGSPGIPRQELLRYLREAAEVLDLLNERYGLQHLDIKPENLFLSGDHVKVADFGLVQPKDTNISRAAIAISPPYAPPELFDGRIEPTADLYSLAVTYQELLTGSRPYRGTDVRALMLQHLKGRPDLSRLPPGDRPLIRKAIDRDPKARFRCCSELVRALEQAPHGEATGAGDREPILTPTPSRRVPVKSDSTEIPRAPARTHHIPSRPLHDTTREPSFTEPLGDSPFRSDTMAPSAETLRATFLAFVPKEIYAHKLRGFLDAMKAEILEGTPQRTILYLGTRGWFGRASERGLFLMIETATRQPHSGFRLVDVTVWSAGRKLEQADLGRRGMLLVRCLKSFLMAIEDADKPLTRSHAELRAAVLA